MKEKNLNVVSLPNDVVVLQNLFAFAREKGSLSLVSLDETLGDGPLLTDDLFQFADQEIALDARRDCAGVIVNLLLLDHDQLMVSGANRRRDSRKQLELFPLLDGGIHFGGSRVYSGDYGARVLALDRRDELRQRKSGRIGAFVRVGRSGLRLRVSRDGAGVDVGVRGVARCGRLGVWGRHDWKMEAKLEVQHEKTWQVGSARGREKEREDGK